MSDQSTLDSDEPASGSENSTADDTADHDCREHLEYIDHNWVDDSYDDLYQCTRCDAEYWVARMKAFMLSADDFSLVEEYTDSIENEIERYRNEGGTDEAAESANE